MRRIDKLIKQIRRQTENEDVGLNYGITEEEFIQYLNDAQERLQSLITTAHKSVFIAEKVYNVKAGVQEYELPEDCYMENKVTTVEYSENSSDDNYYHLKQSTLNRRSTYSEAHPCTYIRRSGKILLQPTPSNNGMLRINYVRKIDRLDKIVGKIQFWNTTEGDPGTPEEAGKIFFTTFRLNTTDGDFPLDLDVLEDTCDISIVDKYGNRKVSMEVDGFNSTTGEFVFNLFPAFEADSGILDVDVGDFIVSGNRTAAQSELPDMCERYLIAYASWKILKRDSSTDSAEQSSELSQMEAEIVASFAHVDDDVMGIPLINTDW